MHCRNPYDRRMTKNTPISGEPHADWHKYALGAILLHHGLTEQDAAALDATLNVPMNEFCGTLIHEDLGTNSSTLGEVIRLFIDHRPARLEARGAGLELERRRRAYLVDRAMWLDHEATTNDHRWRQKMMTKGQRLLVMRTCHRLRCDPPALENRGEAAEWLEAKGAHLELRPDNE